MSIEAKIDALIAALDANTAAHGGAAAKVAPVAAAKPAAAAVKPKAEITMEQVKTAVLAVKEHPSFEGGEEGKIAAQKIIKDAGKSPKLADIKKEYFSAVLQAATKKLDELNAAADEGGEAADDDDSI